MDSITRDVLAGGTNVLYAPKQNADGTETEVKSRKAVSYTHLDVYKRQSVEYALSERCSGVTGYHFLCGLLEQADWAAMGKKLEAVREKVLNHAALTVSLHGSEEALAKLRALRCV